jgi:hypothetical protein
MSTFDARVRQLRQLRHDALERLAASTRSGMKLRRPADDDCYDYYDYYDYYDHYDYYDKPTKSRSRASLSSRGTQI